MLKTMRFVGLTVFALWPAWFLSPPVAHAETSRALVIHSYHQGFPWTDNIMRGMRAVLDQSALKPEIYVEYMDTKRFPPPDSFANLAETYRRKYSQTAFDVILISDNNALTFLLSQRNALFPDVPIVFCGINNFQKALIDQQPAITGITEEIDIAGTISLAVRVLPDIRKFVVVSDRTPTGRANLEKFRAVAADFSDESFSMALKNIVQNAVQAMVGSGTLAISAGVPASGAATIAITDTGPGIPKEHLEKIFEPLFSTKTHGIGFGLSITKMIVENHGGTIQAEAPADGGARFVITLPQDRPPRF